MEWTQFITLMITLIGGVGAIYKFTRDEMVLMNIHHREDMKAMDDKLVRMDEKWERLFEKLLIKEN